MFRTFVFSAVLFGLISCVNNLNVDSSASPIKHNDWTEVLSKYVDQEGLVNYRGLKVDTSLFYQYLEELSSHHPNDKWTKNQQLSYWINAYNAYTIKLILDHYPIESIKEIKTIEIPFLNSIWNKSFIHIETKTYSLNDIEHKILRKKFEEPRIHFAINCASISCPNLSLTAYNSLDIEQQLTIATKNFLNDKTKNDLESKEIKLSRIFKWFKNDFTKNGSLISFINKHQPKQLSEQSYINYLDYNWNLNEQYNN